MRFDLRDDTAPLVRAAVHQPTRLPLRDRLCALDKAREAACGYAARLRPDQRPSFPYGRPDLEAVRFNRLSVQHSRYVDLLLAHGVDVIELPPVVGCASQIFVRDVAFAVDDTLFLARPARIDRRAELAGLRNILGDGASVHQMSAGTIEGGDVIVHSDCVLVGVDGKTSRGALAELRDRLGGRDIVPIELAMRGVAHLDLVCNLVGPGLALVFRPAITDASRAALADRFELIDVRAADMPMLGVNCVSLGPDLVAVSQHATGIAADLERHGIRVLPVACDEVCKAGGGLRCCTLPLVRRTKTTHSSVSSHAMICSTEAGRAK